MFVFPLQILEIVSFSPFKVRVQFFGDNTTAVVYEKQLKPFISGFSLKEVSDTVKKNPKVNSAARTAMIHYFFLKNLHHNLV